MAFSLAEEGFLGDSGGLRIRLFGKWRFRLQRKGSSATAVACASGFLANGVFALAVGRIAFDIRPPVW